MLCEKRVAYKRNIFENIWMEVVWVDYGHVTVGDMTQLKIQYLIPSFQKVIL